MGGDYLSFRNLDDDAYSLLLADLTGHGVTAALFMALLKYISQESPDQVRALPSYFLSYLDMEFYEQIPNGFFTAFSATARYDSTNSSVKIEYANAAHPVAIVVRKNGSHELLNTGDFAVGLLDLVERESHTISLQPGDRLYAYTDGFLETIDADGNEFGLERFCQTLVNARHLSLEDSINFAYQTLDEHSYISDPQDDMSILGIEAKPKTASRDVIDEDHWGDWGEN